MEKSIYSSEIGKAILQKGYDTYLKSLDVNTESIFVQSRFGKTHVLTMGPRNGKPLFVFQGGNSINPVTLSWFLPLSSTYRIYAPDTIGHPGYSAEKRISGKDESLALWVSDIMDTLQVDSSAFIGPSFGGGIILRLASLMPEKISCAILIVPAGIKFGSKLKMIKHILSPLMMYKFTNREIYLQQIFQAMSAGTMNKSDQKVISNIFKFVKLEQKMPNLATKKELRGFDAPTMLIAGENDVFFPTSRLRRPAMEILPNLKLFKSYTMAHFPSNFYLKLIQKDIVHFLEKYY